MYVTGANTKTHKDCGRWEEYNYCAVWEYSYTGGPVVEFSGGDDGVGACKFAECRTTVFGSGECSHMDTQVAATECVRGIYDFVKDVQADVFYGNCETCVAIDEYHFDSIMRHAFNYKVFGTVFCGLAIIIYMILFLWWYCFPSYWEEEDHPTDGVDPDNDIIINEDSPDFIDPEQPPKPTAQNLNEQPRKPTAQNMPVHWRL